MENIKLTEKVKKFYILDHCPPISWKRAGRNESRYYDKQALEKSMAILHLKKQHGDMDLFSKPLHLDVSFFMRLPETRARHKNGDWSDTYPDVDNLLKFICDTMSKVIITDDRIICSVSAKKIKSARPRTEFSLMEL